MAGVKGRAVFEVLGKRMELEMLDIEYIHHEKFLQVNFWNAFRKHFPD